MTGGVDRFELAKEKTNGIEPEDMVKMSEVGMENWGELTGVG